MAISVNFEPPTKGRSRALDFNFISDPVLVRTSQQYQNARTLERTTGKVVARSPEVVDGLAVESFERSLF